jgi:hypothetical protein
MKTLRIDDDSHLAVLQFSGIVTSAELNSGLEEHDCNAKEYSLLIDLSAVQKLHVTSDDIREAAKRWGSGVSKCAIVAASTVTFGLARMYEMYSGNPQIVIFRNAAAAFAWLRAEPGWSQPPR